MKQKFSLIVFFLLLTTCLFAQVTIGSGIEPNKGHLLELKQNNNLEENSEAGLLLPRVNLEKRNELYPMFSSGDPLYTDEEKIKHTGLIVFNLTTDTAEDLCPGPYMWDGSTWKRLWEWCYSFEFLCDSIGANNYIEHEGKEFNYRNAIYYKSVVEKDIQFGQAIPYGDGLEIIFYPQIIEKSDKGLLNFAVFSRGTTPVGVYQLSLSKLKDVLGMDISGSCIITVDIIGPEFTLDCANVTTTTPVGVTMNKTIQVPYNVSKAPYTIPAGNIGSAVNGITPSIASQQVLNTTTGYIPVTLQGTPTNVKNTSIPITVAGSACEIGVDVVNTFSLDCSGVSTTATVDEYMNKTVQVRYTLGEAPYTIPVIDIGSTVNGITPSIATQQVLTTTTGYVTVTLQGTPENAVNTFVPITIGESTCSIEVDIDNTFSINCAGVTATAPVNTLIKKTVRVPYTVGMVPYTIPAGNIGDAVNGITPSIANQQTLTTKTGYVTVTLNGTATNAGNTSIPITIQGSSCSVGVTVTNTFSITCTGATTTGTVNESLINKTVRVPYTVGSVPYTVPAGNIGSAVNGITPSIASQRVLTEKTGYITVTLQGKPVSAGNTSVPITIGESSCSVGVDVANTISIACTGVSTTGVLGQSMTKTVQVRYELGSAPYTVPVGNIGSAVDGITPSIAASQTLTTKTGYITITLKGTPLAQTINVPIRIGTGNTCSITVNSTSPISLSCGDVYTTGYVGIDMSSTPETSVAEIPYTLSGGAYTLTARDIGTQDGITAYVETQTLSGSGVIKVKFKGVSVKALDKVQFPVNILSNTCSIYLSLIKPPGLCSDGREARAFVFQQNSKWYVVAINGTTYNGIQVAQTIECNTEEEALRHPQALQYCAFDQTSGRCLTLYNRNGVFIGNLNMTGAGAGLLGGLIEAKQTSGCIMGLIAYQGGRPQSTFMKKGYLGAVNLSGGKGYFGITTQRAIMTTKPLR